MLALRMAHQGRVVCTLSRRVDVAAQALHPEGAAHLKHASSHQPSPQQRDKEVGIRLQRAAWTPPPTSVWRHAIRYPLCAMLPRASAYQRDDAKVSEPGAPEAYVDANSVTQGLALLCGTRWMLSTMRIALLTCLASQLVERALSGKESMSPGPE